MKLIGKINGHALHHKKDGTYLLDGEALPLKVGRLLKAKITGVIPANLVFSKNPSPGKAAWLAAKREIEFELGCII